MLTVNNLKTGYGGKTLISLDRLAVKAGGTCLITGASGSGKTTLLYAFAGLGDVQSGEVRVDGTSLYALRESERDRWRGEKIGIVFQNLNLVKSLTVLDNILLGSFVTRRDQNIARADALLTKLGIADLRDRSATDISQGQAQRVAIARAVLNKPKLILADEPTSSLDDKAAQQVANLLASLSAETGATLVVSTHDARIKGGFDQVLALGDLA